MRLAQSCRERLWKSGRDGAKGGKLTGGVYGWMWRSEEYGLWHPLVVLHTPCLIKRTSNALADFLSLSRPCVRAACVRVRGPRVFAEEGVLDVLFM